MIIPGLNSFHQSLRKLCFDAICNVFQNDPKAEISLKITRLISQFIKTKNYSVLHTVLETFSFLKITEREVKDVNVFSRKVILVKEEQK